MTLSAEQRLERMSQRCRYYRDGNCTWRGIDFFTDSGYVRKECTPLDCYADLFDGAIE